MTQLTQPINAPLSAGHSDLSEICVYALGGQKIFVETETTHSDGGLRAAARQGGSTVSPSPVRHGGTIPVFRAGYDRQISMAK